MRAVLRTVMWVAIAVFAAAVFLEIALQYRVEWKLSHEPQSVIGDLDRDYFAFSVQHLHPQYLFSFPLDPDARLAIGNKTVSLDRDGFREPGPAHANGRKLAILLGGSGAFSFYSSSNDTTLTSYLNRLQDEYFFVNAGVPSWNSSQDLSRLIHQIAGMKPALVITYDGANDAELAQLFSPRTGKPYPPGTPESFDELERWVDDIRSDKWVFRPPILFPEIRHRIRKYTAMDEDDGEEDRITEAGVAAAVRQYLTNQELMATISRSIGARFIAVYQPIASLHRNVPEAFQEEDAPSIQFHRGVASAGARPYESHDLSTWFDTQMSAVPAGEPNGNDPIFVDDVHLFDRGNEMIAKKLWEIVQAPPKP